MASMAELDPPSSLPSEYVNLRQVRGRRIKVVRNRTQLQYQVKNPRIDQRCGDDGDDEPVLPPNYTSLRQLRELRLNEKEEKVEQREREEGSDKQPFVPANYVSLKQLRELWLKKKEEEEDSEKARHEELKKEPEEIKEKEEESDQIEAPISKKSDKSDNPLRKSLIKKQYKLGHMNSNTIWQPVHPISASTILLPSKAGTTGEASVSGLNVDTATKPKYHNKNKKKKKKKESYKNREITSAMDMSGLKMPDDTVLNSINAEKDEDTVSQMKNVNKKKKKKEKKKKGGRRKIDFTMSGTQQITTTDNKQTVELETVNTSDAVKEINASKDVTIVNNCEGKSVNITESSDQTRIVNGVKPSRARVHGVMRKNEKVGYKGRRPAKKFIGRTTATDAGAGFIWVPKKKT